MTLLLDTHVLLWWLGDDPRLPADVAALVGDGAEEVAVSAATVWEIGIKRALGKLQAPDDLLEEVERSGFTPWQITPRDADAAGRLPRHHDDPFDRMLLAQAQQRGAALASVDRRFPAYGVRLLGQ